MKPPLTHPLLQMIMVVLVAVVIWRTSFTENDTGSSSGIEETIEQPPFTANTQSMIDNASKQADMAIPNRPRGIRNGNRTNANHTRNLTKPNQILEKGFAWTEEYHDPKRMEEPGYRDKVIKHLYTKHYYHAPERRQTAFQQSRALTKAWSIPPTLENMVMLHDAAAEWHLYYSIFEASTGPAAGPNTIEQATFKWEFKQQTIKSRFEDLFGINDEAFVEQLIKIKPQKAIGSPALNIEPGERLMTRIPPNE